MKTKLSNGFWTDEFKAWVSGLYHAGFGSSEIAKQAHEEHDVTISRNAVIGLVHRCGAGAQRMQHRVGNRFDSNNMRSAMISLPGPEWSIPNRENIRRAA